MEKEKEKITISIRQPDLIEHVREKSEKMGLSNIGFINMLIYQDLRKEKDAVPAPK